MRRVALGLAPFLLAAAIFLAGLLVVGHRSYRANEDHLVYTRDDPYIHMAIARNLALNGVFGLTQHGFSSATSSPLWTLLLSATYTVTGVSDWVPGLWATLFAVAGLYAVHSLCILLGLKILPRFIVCLAVTYFTPLVPLVSTGMEHAMHLFFVIVLIASTIRFMESPGRRELVVMCLVGCLATASRYESLFLVAPVSVSLLFKKRRSAVLPFVISSLLPVVAYGTISVIHGSYFLPNSLVLKGQFPHVRDMMSLAGALGGRAFATLTNAPHLYSIGLLALLGSYSLGKQSSSFQVIALSLACAMLLHLQYAATASFYRYEAYIVAAFMPILGRLHLGQDTPLSHLLRRRGYAAGMPWLASGILLLWPLHQRAIVAIEGVVPASTNIYLQQYQMGRFLQEMYEPGVRVAVNDVGAVTFFADTDVLDLWGLGTIEVARAKREDRYDAQAIASLLSARMTEVVIVYADWFEGLLPSSLIPVATWSVPSRFYGGTVTWFGTSDRNAALLQERLHRYQKTLPGSVRVSYDVAERNGGQPP